MTQKLFQKSPYLKEYTGKVVSVDGDRVVCDATIFAPEAGGQVSDTGTINGVPVIHVIEENQEVIHLLETPIKGLTAGAEVEMKLDWKRRFDHMQNHCGEHILSGILFREYGFVNKGFHLGETNCTLDVDTKDFSEEMITKVEDLANQCIYDHKPVSIDIIESREDAEKFPLRKEIKAEEDISIVTIDGVDCVACCCPHPFSTAEVGIIKVIRTEKYKGMTRITFKCGFRALEDYQQKHKVITALNEKYSADDFTLLDKIKIQDGKVNDIRRELGIYKEKFAEIEATMILNGSDKIAVKEYEKETLDDLRRIAKKMMEKSNLPVALSTLNGCSLLLTHNGKSKIKCGEIVKEFAVGSGGKGGGSHTQAQAVFNSPDLMRNFISIVKAHV